MQETDLPLGVSVSGTSQAETIDLALTLGLFDAVQATWNLHERAAEGALGRAHAAGLKVIVKEALANGRLARPRRRGAGRGAGPAVGDVVLSGAASIEVLRSNLRARDTAPPDLGEPEDSAAYWATRSALPWN